MAFHLGAVAQGEMSEDELEEIEEGPIEAISSTGASSPQTVVFGGTVARYAVFTGQLACLGAAFAPSANGMPLWGAASLTFYVKYLIPSLTVLDLGIREGGAAFFFQILGLGAAAGLNAALLLFALNVLVPALLGVPFLATLRLSSEAPQNEHSLLTIPSGS